MNDKIKRVAIIGAGPSGLSAMRAFALARDAGQEIPQIVCYEKLADWGGQWCYTWRTGLDEHGEPVHSSMYKYLWSNGPKECLEFSDYSFEEHFGQPIPSYPPREVLADYIYGRAQKSDVRDWIKFHHAVRWVERADGGGFTLCVEDLEKGVRDVGHFDHVIVASGHFSTPNVPQFEGIETFPARVMHAHDFRSADEFTSRDVLIVGASYSAEDIGLQCKKYGAKSVTFTYRTAPMEFDWPDGMDERPLLTRIDGSSVTFSDGTSKDFDAIILCTGYLHSFPYMQDELRLRTINRLYPDGLYQGVVWNDDPALFYLGMADQWYTFTMFDAQAWYVRDVIMGKVTLPNHDERAKDIAKWDARENSLEDAYQMIDYQADYIRELMRHCDYPQFDIALSQKEFKIWKGAKEQSIIGYRNKAHTSPVTGTLSPVHHTPWWSAMDDTMKTYIG